MRECSVDNRIYKLNRCYDNLVDLDFVPQQHQQVGDANGDNPPWSNELPAVLRTIVTYLSGE